MTLMFVIVDLSPESRACESTKLSRPASLATAKASHPILDDS